MGDGFGGVRVCRLPDEGAARAVWAKVPDGMRGFVAQGLARHPLRDLAR